MEQGPKLMLPHPPVGVKLVRPGEEGPWLKAFQKYRGISFCEAVKRCSGGERLWLEPGSIDTCKWSPPILGLKTPETEFEKDREPRLPFLAAAVAVGRLDAWPVQAPAPEVALIRADRDGFRRLLNALPPERVFAASDKIDRTAVPIVLGGEPRPIVDALIRGVNGVLAWMWRFDWWHRLTVRAFKAERVARALNFLLDRGMANMSMCRNSTVIPFLTDRVNVSHFCTGAISWGRNQPNFMTGGLPLKDYRRIEDMLDWAGRA